MPAQGSLALYKGISTETVTSRFSAHTNKKAWQDQNHPRR